MLNQKEEGAHFACKKGKKTVNSKGIKEHGNSGMLGIHRPLFHHSIILTQALKGAVCPLTF